MRYKVISLIFIIIFIGSLLTLGYSNATLKNPFDKVKEYALSCPINEKGNYMWERTLGMKDDSGTDLSTSWMLGYEPKINRVGMAKWVGENGLILLCYVDSGKYEVIYIVNGQVKYDGELKEDKAIEMAYKFFRELVSNKLI